MGSNQGNPSDKKDWIRIKVCFGSGFNFEAEGREQAVVDAYTRALEALVAVTPKATS